MEDPVGVTGHPSRSGEIGFLLDSGAIGVELCLEKVLERHRAVRGGNFITGEIGNRYEFLTGNDNFRLTSCEIKLFWFYQTE